MHDFTLKTYKKLLQQLLASGYSFQTLKDFVQQPEDKSVILRHDVDRKPENALRIAEIEQATGINASFYFRIVRESYDEGIIKKIEEMGHEIGYHYEDLCLCDANYELAIKSFAINLEEFRKICQVKTICMHGSPMSKWDNKNLWKRYAYRDFGIIAEPYFDIDFGEVFYLTDTGRRWDGEAFNVRDKVEGMEDGGQSSEVGIRVAAVCDLRFRTTWDIIKAIEEGLLPDKVMLNTHPQRWDDKFWPWVNELVLQNFKNVIKKIFYVRT